MEDFLRLGLLNWYPWEKGTSVLLISGCREMEQDLKRRGLEVKRIDFLQEAEEDTSFDYVIVSPGEELLGQRDQAKDFIRKMLKPKGHLFLACENRLALRYFVGDEDPYTGGSFDGIENYCNYTKVAMQGFHGRCYARNEIQKAIDSWGFAKEQYRGYSVFPGLEMPQLLFAWDYLPKENMESRYNPMYHDPSRVFLNETRICDGLIENGMFHAMANAFLVDCSFEGQFYEWDQVTTSMDRGEEKATATILQKDGTVIKRALYPKGNEAIRTLAENMKRLKDRGIKVVDLQVQKRAGCDGEELWEAKMPYVTAPLAMEYLQKLPYQDVELFKREVCKFLDTVKRSGQAVLTQQGELGDIYDRVYYDLVPINCFFVDGEFVFFDQEYAIRDYPINVVLARVISFVYTGNRSLEDICPMSYFTKKYGLEDKLGIYLAMSTNYLDDLRHARELMSFHRSHKVDFSTMHLNRQKMQYDTQTFVSLFYNYLDGIQGKKLFLFGSGQWAKKFAARYGDVLEIEGMLDNDSSKWGKNVGGIPVRGPDILNILEPDSYKLILCVKQYSGILRQIKEMGVRHYGIYDPDIDVGGVSLETGGAAIPVEVVTAGGLSSDCTGQNSETTTEKPYHVGYVAGAFDLFHIGHLNLLRRAKEQCDILLVGVISDENASQGKKRSPYVSERERCEIVNACKYVDHAFVLPTVAAGGRDVFRKYHFDVMFSGDDHKDEIFWQQEREWLRERGADIVFFPYTESTSSTKLKEAIEKE